MDKTVIDDATFPQDDPDLCKLLNEWEKEEAERKNDPELNVSWESLLILENWRNWLSVAKKKDKLLYEVWSDLEGCFECKHLNKKDVWCKLQSIPATINPILTLRLGMVGMACMGAGKEIWTQIRLCDLK